jgi:hypothetical protein
VGAIPPRSCGNDPEDFGEASGCSPTQRSREKGPRGGVPAAVHMERLDSWGGCYSILMLSVEMENKVVVLTELDTAIVYNE